MTQLHFNTKAFNLLRKTSRFTLHKQFTETENVHNWFLIILERIIISLSLAHRIMCVKIFFEGEVHLGRGNSFSFLNEKTREFLRVSQQIWLRNRLKMEKGCENWKFIIVLSFSFGEKVAPSITIIIYRSD